MQELTVGTVQSTTARTTGTPTVRTMTPADEAPAVDTIVLAFAADPMARWSWPDPSQYLAAMPALARAFGG
ncbi:MAG TPA: hypothetical protein VF136_16870, partial [Methylomirabilota bacterium]